jgi:pimeloyl-ACP methyl ester carboxylesterase
MIKLGRWLGPWADPAGRPAAAVHDDDLDGMRVRIYRPVRGRTRRVFLIAPGLHYAAADDPRMDRFCRILTTAGHLVVVPYIPDFLALVPTERAKADFLRAFDALPRWIAGPTGAGSEAAGRGRLPVVFSISFGSLLAFSLAAARPGAIDRLIVFGGYADLRETLRFSLTGEVASGRAAVRDPLNQPVVLLNLLDQLDPPAPAGADREALIAGWRRYVERTWGRAELKLDRRFAAIAEELLPTVPPAVRELFLVGTGARPGAAPLALAALARFDARPLDPAPYLPRITGRVDLVHGVDDDVIPFEHAHALAAGLVNADVRVHLTGMYGHTGSSRPPLAAATRELATLVRVLRLLAA